MGFGETLTVSRSLIDEARNLLPSWRAVTEPATPVERMTILRDLADVVGMPDALRSKDGARIAKFFSAYHDDLGRLPGYVLERACAEYRRRPLDRPKFFPDSGTLLAIARQDEEWRHTQMLMKGIERLSKAKAEPGQRTGSTDAEWADIERRIAAFSKRARDLDAQERAESDEANRQALARYRRAEDAPFDNTRLVKL